MTVVAMSHGELSRYDTLLRFQRGEEIDRIIAAGMRFGSVLADASYGLAAPFRQALSARGLHWAVGIPRHQRSIPPTCS